MSSSRYPRNYNPVAEALSMPDTPILRTTAYCESGMAFLELDCCRQNFGLTQPVQEEAFLIALQLKTCPDFDLFADGRFIRPQQFNAGAIAIFDLRTNLATDLRDPFHAINLYLPIKALKNIAEELGAPAIDELRHRPGTAVMDAAATNLLLSMRPALAAGQKETPALFVDHMAMAMATHIASTYGCVRLPRRVYRGGLAPWQERRAKELLNANLAGGVSLSDLARACEVSVRHFTRAFRQSTGMTPHGWLLHYRIEKAKSLLANSPEELANVALNCGFADQSHFIRAFSHAVGVTPGRWRRFVRN